jgi:hypothetical protein
LNRLTLFGREKNFREDLVGLASVYFVPLVVKEDELRRVLL